MRLVVVLLCLGALVGCGTASATTTSATPTPAFARYTVPQVVAAFREAGLYTVDPYILRNGTLPSPPTVGTAFAIWGADGPGPRFPMVFVVETQSPVELGVWRAYLSKQSEQSIRITDYQIRRNVILGVHAVGANTKPDMSQYWAVFAALP